MNHPTKRGQIVLAVIVAGVVLCGGTRVSAGGKVTWTPYSNAALRIDGDPPKEWNIYHGGGGKENEIVLLQWGKRYLRLDAGKKEVLELDPHSITHEKEKVIWSGDEATARVLPSSDWIFRNVGAAQRMHLALSAENHEIEIDLPHGGK